jgi:Zinc carboxypeptidase
MVQAFVPPILTICNRLATWRLLLCAGLKERSTLLAIRRKFCVRSLKIKIIFSIVISHFSDVASGTSPDWAYGAAGTKLSFTYEFRDLGETNFVLPANEIVPNAREVLDSLVAMMKEATLLGYMPRRS